MNTIDIAFVLDCTASMQPWIDAAKRQIHRTLDALQNTHPNWSFQIALVIYRDFGDAERISVLDFTQTFDHFDRMLAECTAEGGDDIPEDFAGAMHITSGLSWTSRVRHVFIITDAPPHGNKYHEPRIADRFPYGDPAGRILEEDVDILTSKQVNMTFMRIHPRTDILIDCLRGVYVHRQYRGATFTVQELPPHLPPPPWGMEREREETISDDDEPSPITDITLSRMVSRAVTQSMSMYDPTD
jgi:hypothetical protein